jgi:hypothetical protein
MQRKMYTNLPALVHTIWQLLHHVSASTRNLELHILSKLHVSLCRVRANCTALFKLQYILMHWAIMHKMCKTEYSELNTDCWPDVCATTLCTGLSTYVEGRCWAANFIGFCIFYSIRLYMMAHCIRSYCNVRLECTFTLSSVIYILN